MLNMVVDRTGSYFSIEFRKKKLFPKTYGIEMAKNRC